MAGHLPGVVVVFTSVVVPNIFTISPTLPAESVATFLGGSLLSLLSPHTLGGTRWGGFCCRLTGKDSCEAWVVVVGVMLAILGVFNPSQCAILQRVVPGGTDTVPPYLIFTLWLPLGSHILLGNLVKLTSLGGLWFWWWLVLVVGSCLVVVGGTMANSGLVGGTFLWVSLVVRVLVVLVVAVAACLTGVIVIFFFVFGFSFFLQLFTFFNFSFSNLLLSLANFDMKISFSFFSSLVLNLNHTKNVPIGPGVVGGVAASWCCRFSSFCFL